MPRRILWIALVTLAATAPAFAQLQMVSISNPWIRFITPQTPAAGYFTVTNVGAHPVAIIGASSPACGSLMLHQSRNVNGTEHMEAVASVSVPAHGSGPLRTGRLSPDVHVAVGRHVAGAQRAGHDQFRRQALDHEAVRRAGPERPLRVTPARRIRAGSPFAKVNTVPLAATCDGGRHRPRVAAQCHVIGRCRRQAGKALT